VVEAIAGAIAFAVHRMLAGTLDALGALHDDLAAVIEAVAGALTLGAAGLDTVGTETGRALYIDELHVN
jgi:hypothetical protein